MNTSEFEAQYQVKLTPRLKQLYRRLVMRGDMSPKRFYEKMRANAETVRRILKESEQHAL